MQEHLLSAATSMATSRRAVTKTVEDVLIAVLLELKEGTVLTAAKVVDIFLNDLLSLPPERQDMYAAVLVEHPSFELLGANRALVSQSILLGAFIDKYLGV